MARGIKWELSNGRARDFRHVQSHAMWMARVASEERAILDHLEVVVAEAKNAPCKDCGKTYAPHVMQFDHLDPKTKSFSIGQFRTLFPSVEILRAEIAKCELVCANCHAERTQRRREAVREARAVAARLRRVAEQRRAQAEDALPPEPIQ